MGLPRPAPRMASGYSILRHADVPPKPPIGIGQVNVKEIKMERELSRLQQEGAHEADLAAWQQHVLLRNLHQQANHVRLAAQQTSQAKNEVQALQAAVRKANNQISESTRHAKLLERTMAAQHLQYRAAPVRPRADGPENDEFGHGAVKGNAPRWAEPASNASSRGAMSHQSDGSAVRGLRRPGGHRPAPQAVNTRAPRSWSGARPPSPDSHDSARAAIRPTNGWDTPYRAPPIAHPKPGAGFPSTKNQPLWYHKMHARPVRAHRGGTASSDARAAARQADVWMGMDPREREWAFNRMGQRRVCTCACTCTWAFNRMGEGRVCATATACMQPWGRAGYAYAP